MNHVTCSHKVCFKTAALVLRLVIGALFLYSGIIKLMNMEMIIGFCASMGLSVAIAWLVTIGEIAAGAALIAGIFTRIASVIVIIIMIGATILTAKATGFNSAIPTLVYLFAGVSLFLSGPGSFALAHCCGTKCDQDTCSNGSCETK